MASTKNDIARFVDDLDVDETDFVFVFDANGVAKSMHIPFHLEDDDRMPLSVSAVLELYAKYMKQYSNTIH